MKKSINEIFRECAEAEGLCSYMYARIAEANYLMDDVKQYPVLLRQFNETISETRMSDMRRRTTTLYFCDALGKADAVDGYRGRACGQRDAFLRQIRRIGGRRNPKRYDDL